MKRCEVDVVETVTMGVTYIVEAETLEEATTKAEIGDTVEEYGSSPILDVVGREAFEIKEVSE